MKTSKNLRTTLDIGSHINASGEPLLEAVGCTPLFGPGPLPRLNIQTTLPDRYPQMYMSAHCTFHRLRGPRVPGSSGDATPHLQRQIHN